MEIKREMQSPTYREWRVRVGETEYKVGWQPPQQWGVQVLVKSRKSEYAPPHWRSIKGAWIVRKVRAFETS